MITIKDQLLSASRDRKLSYFKSILNKIVYCDKAPLFDAINDQPSVMHQIFQEPHNSEFIREVLEFGYKLNIMERFVVVSAQMTKCKIHM